MNESGNITKYDCLKILLGQGFDAEIGTDGAVVIYIEMREYMKRPKKYKDLIKQIGFNGSWGLKPKELKHD